jgi:hypothetical protein
MNENKFTIGVFFYLKKAFDVCSHDILLMKLSKMGITECRSYKLLGIFLDEHLTLDAYVNHICTKLTKSMFCIKQAKHNILLSGSKSLYFALFLSHLTYCTFILNSITASNRKIIEKVQEKAICIMTGSCYNAHTKPLFLQHAILPFDKLIIQSQLNFMHAIE